MEKIDEKFTLTNQASGQNVIVPTIMEVVRFGGNYVGHIYVRWFGESSIFDLGDRQFRFPFPVKSDSIIWMGDSEHFQVVFLGKVRNLPKSSAVSRIAELVAKQDPERVVIWIVSTHYGIRYDSGVGPASPLLPMPIMLADRICGIIHPKPFMDLDVLERANAKFQQIDQLGP